MDVSSISRLFRGFAQYTTQAKNSNNTNTNDTKSAQTSQGQTSATAGSAFEIDISDAARAAVTQSKQQELAVEDESTKQTKGLGAEAVRQLEDDLAAQEHTMLNIMIQALTESNNKLQGWFDEGTGILNFGGVQIEASLFAMPKVATNPEDAAKAIAPGGEWSVDAVAGRIFDLASAIAGNDPEKLSAMRAAVEKGFQEAGLTWKDSTGQSSLPEISNQTYDEIMSRFDKRANELNGTSTVK